MRRFVFALLYLALLAASCAPQSVPSVTEELPTPLIVSANAPEIRFALVGNPRDVNVWALFDQAGASYADYALRFEYWPRLYHLAPPEFSFQPLAAQNLPTDVTQEGGFYSSIVKLRPDLKWTDGSRFTAEDVVFTVNTALTFELGFDWDAYYSREYLEHAEALDPTTVKFVFKQKPNVRIWQYGALQGPVVQRLFWESRLAGAKNLLPEDPLKIEIEAARANLAMVQRDVDELTGKLIALKASGLGSRPLEIEVEHRQRELGFAQNTLDDLLEEYASRINIAHQALYILDDSREPTLGAWVFTSKTSDVWVNTANFEVPFGKPNFDRAVYNIFDNEKDAVTAFKNKEVDFVLSPNGVLSSKDARIISTYSARFLVFNPLKTQFADPTFHIALSCMIDRSLLSSDLLENKVLPLNAFILSSQWHNPEIKMPCAGMNRTDRIHYAVNLLKDAGYSWLRQPTANSAGTRLFNPNRTPFPNITLNAPFKDADPLRYIAAKYIAEQAQFLGISFSVREMSVNDVIYAVYSSQKFDAALIGWRLSEYPGYICEWFGGDDQYLFNGGRFVFACDALESESNMDAARQSFYQIESELMTDLPFIPLFTMSQAELYQNITYPAPDVLNGWGGLYGAPSYAIPSP